MGGAYLVILIPVFILLCAGLVVVARADRRPSRRAAVRAVFWGVGLAVAAVVIGLVAVWVPADGQVSRRIVSSVGPLLALAQVVVLARRQLAQSGAEDDTEE